MSLRKLLARFGLWAELSLTTARDERDSQCIEQLNSFRRSIDSVTFIGWLNTSPIERYNSLRHSQGHRRLDSRRRQPFSHRFFILCTSNRVESKSAKLVRAVITVHRRCRPSKLPNLSTVCMKDKAGNNRLGKRRRPVKYSSGRGRRGNSRDRDGYDRDGYNRGYYDRNDRDCYHHDRPRIDDRYRPIVPTSTTVSVTIVPALTTAAIVDAEATIAIVEAEATIMPPSPAS